MAVTVISCSATARMAQPLPFRGMLQLEARFRVLGILQPERTGSARGPAAL